MTQRGYAITFMIVLLAACAGAFLGGRFIWSRLQGDANNAGDWKPPVATVAADETLVADAPAGTPQPVPAGTALAQARAAALASGKPTVRRPTIPTPLPGNLDLPTAEYALADTPDPFASPTPDVFASPTEPLPTVTPTQPPFPFVLTRPVRDSQGDCPGNYALGTVTDHSGQPLPNVRLELVDEYGNAETKVTKSEPGVAGRYDFPIFGPPRIFYLSVIDGAGNPLSMKAVFEHGKGAHPQAGCHWVDWQRK